MSRKEARTPGDYGASIIAHLQQRGGEGDGDRYWVEAPKQPLFRLQYGE
ncbi:MAG: hypothetical protein JRH20_05495 [Deltaproteobacteria bacterium]|nr:hypothetical protein [Deltaproteobacteria bacterium]